MGSKIWISNAIFLKTVLGEISIVSSVNSVSSSNSFSSQFVNPSIAASSESKKKSVGTDSSQFLERSPMLGISPSF